MPPTPKLPGAFKTTVFLSAQNKDSLMALATERGATVLLILNTELDYSQNFGLLKPHRLHLEAEAEKQGLTLRELVQGILTECAMALPEASVPDATPRRDEDFVKTTVALAPGHHERLSAVGTKDGLPMSFLINQELDFVRTYGLPLPLLRRLQERADATQISLRDLVQLLLIERLPPSGLLDVAPAAPLAPKPRPPEKAKKQRSSSK